MAAIMALAAIAALVGLGAGRQEETAGATAEAEGGALATAAVEAEGEALA